MLVVPERRAALDQLVVHATTLRIPVVELEGGSLTALAGFDGHQGIALVAKPRPTADLTDIVAHARQRGGQPFVLVLDSLEDPQNFGTLLRSAEATGVDGVVYPTRRAAPLSPSAIKASAGATEHMLLAPVDDLAGALVDLRGHGLRIVGADENASLDYSEADLRGPLAIVVGSEGRGISGPVRKRLDMAVRIPMRGKIASLNASVAGSLLLFAAASQRPDPAPLRAEAPKRDPCPSRPCRRRQSRSSRRPRPSRRPPTKQRPSPNAHGQSQRPLPKPLHPTSQRPSPSAPVLSRQSQRSTPRPTNQLSSRNVHAPNQQNQLPRLAFPPRRRRQTSRSSCRATASRSGSVGFRGRPRCWR